MEGVKLVNSAPCRLQMLPEPLALDPGYDGSDHRSMFQQ